MGFTTLELIVAVVILAVLATIAIPTYEHSTSNATLAKEATAHRGKPRVDRGQTLTNVAQH